MPFRKLNPTSPGTRFQTVQTFDDVTTQEPHKPLVEPLKRTGGHANSPRTANQAARGAQPTEKPNTRWLSDVNLLVYEYESRIASVGKDK